LALGWAAVKYNMVGLGGDGERPLFFVRALVGGRKETNKKKKLKED
jgi:hypothetical protein